MVASLSKQKKTPNKYNTPTCAHFFFSEQEGEQINTLCISLALLTAQLEGAQRSLRILKE